MGKKAKIDMGNPGYEVEDKCLPLVYRKQYTYCTVR